MHRTQIDLDEHQAARQEQWRKALEGTAGIASYFGEGADYVEEVRRVDAGRLARFERRISRLGMKNILQFPGNG